MFRAFDTLSTVLFLDFPPVYWSVDVSARCRAALFRGSSLVADSCRVLSAVAAGRYCTAQRYAVIKSDSSFLHVYVTIYRSLS